MLDETPLFFEAALDELYELDEDGESSLVQDLIHDFVIQADLLVKRVLSNFETQNLSEMEEAAHSLKSSSRVLGCLRLGMLAEEVESCSRDRQFEKTVPFVSALNDTFAATRAALLAHKRS